VVEVVEIGFNRVVWWVVPFLPVVREVQFLPCAFASKVLGSLYLMEGAFEGDMVPGGESSPHGHVWLDVLPRLGVSKARLLNATDFGSCWVLLAEDERSCYFLLASHWFSTSEG